MIKERERRSVVERRVVHAACGWIHSTDAHNCHCFAKNELVESLGQKRLVQRGSGRTLEAVPQRGRECRILSNSRERKKKSKIFWQKSDSPTFQQYVDVSQPGC